MRCAFFALCTVKCTGSELFQCGEYLFSLLQNLLHLRRLFIYLLEMISYSKCLSLQREILSATNHWIILQHVRVFVTCSC